GPWRGRQRAWWPCWVPRRFCWAGRPSTWCARSARSWTTPCAPPSPPPSGTSWCAICPASSTTGRAGRPSSPSSSSSAPRSELRGHLGPGRPGPCSLEQRVDPIVERDEVRAVDLPHPALVEGRLHDRLDRGGVLHQWVEPGLVMVQPIGERSAVQPVRCAAVDRGRGAASRGRKERRSFADDPLRLVRGKEGDQTCGLVLVVGLHGDRVP